MYDTIPYCNNSAPGQPLPPTPPQGQDQPPIVYNAVPANTCKNFVAHYERKTSTGLGATQIILACVSIAAGVMAIEFYAGLYYVGIGIWAGTWYLITGSLAIAAGKAPTNKLITATLVFSVFDILFGIAQVTIAAYGVAYELYCYEGKPPFYPGTCGGWWERRVTANSMMIGVGSLEIIFGLWMTVISGHAIDRGSKPQLTFAPNQQEPAFTQVLSPPPVLQSDPPSYYERLQHPLTSNQQQMVHVGVHQAPLTAIKL